MMEQSEQNPNLFTTSIGNLPPGKEVTVEVTYVTEIHYSEGLVNNYSPLFSFSFSNLHLKKSFASLSPPQSQRILLSLLTETIQPSVLPSKCHSVSASFDRKLPQVIHLQSIDMTSNIKSVTSPSHPVSFEFGDIPSQATVTMNNSNIDKDFQLTIKLAKPHE